MASDLAARRVHDRAGAVRAGGLSLDEGRVVAVGHEADLLALGLVGDGQAALARDAPHLGLVEVADREERRLELLRA